MSLNCALIGFEFAHHVPAMIRATQSVANNGVEIDIRLWSSREGVKAEVNKSFPNALFVDLDQVGRLRAIKNYAKRNGLDTSSRDAFIHDFPLTAYEIRHFSYTLSRHSMLRQPQKPTSREIDGFVDFTAIGLEILKQQNVSVVFMPSVPHTPCDLGIAFAARRLNVSLIVLYQVAFNDYVYARRFFFDNDDCVNPQQLHKFDPLTECREYCVGADEVCRFLATRNRRSDEFAISYQNPTLLARLPSIAQVKRTWPNRKVSLETVKCGFSFFVNFFRRAITWPFRRLRDQLLGNKLLGVYRSRKYNEIDLGSLRKNKEYFLVALQYHPELTASMSAFETPFEEEVLVRLAKRFPNVIVYAREHPAMLWTGGETNYFRYRGPKFFKTLEGYKNIVYVQQDKEDCVELIEKAKCVIAITGTMAFEAVLLGTPVIHLGYSPAVGLPGLAIVKSIDDVSEELIVKLKEDLNDLSVDQIAESYAATFNSLNPTPAFIGGFHEREYSESEYVSAAEKVFVNMLRLASRVSQP